VRPETRCPRIPGKPTTIKSTSPSPSPSTPNDHVDDHVNDHDHVIRSGP